MIGNENLFTFYRSKSWNDLLKVIKQERVNSDGHIICAYCGKPIVRAYDCIGHHVIELTEENVNDAEISLNPDNIVLVHHRCHNFIHNKLEYKTRYVYLVYGPPLSGKTAWVKENQRSGDLVVNVDNIWECVSGCERFVKPGTLNAVVFGVKEYLLDCIRYRKGKWKTAYVVGGYPICSERERLCKTLGAQEIFIEATRDECLQRLQQREKPLIIKDWISYIDRWFDQYGPPGET